MLELIRRWRREARQMTGLDGPVILLSEAANEVEQAWHDDNHGAEWYPEICQICINEMEQEQNETL